MFFFEKIPLPTLLMILFMIVVLLVLNEVTRRYKWPAVAIYIALPLVLTLFVWPTTAGAGSTSGYWFAWVKTYSALAGVIGFMAIRYIKKLDGSKFMFLFPALILSINILEAVYRDIEIFMGFNGVQVMENGLTMMGGPWNLMNAAAGILNIVTITGWLGIRIARTKSKDMVWPDMLWFWIIAYDLWNVAYCYNCISDRSMYSGVILIVAATIAAFFFKKGAWLQHRAQTLALYAMFNLTFPAFADASQFAVKASHNPAALMVLSAAALAVNVAVLVYELAHMKKRSIRNPIKNDIYSDLPAYHAALKDNSLAPQGEHSPVK